MIVIDDLLGVRYISGGCDKRGYDCYGLAVEVEHRLGYELPKLNTVGKDGVDVSIEGRDIIASLLVSINKPTYEGDIILFKDTKGIMWHIGVYLGNGYFIHCNKYGVHLDKVRRYEHTVGKVYTWHR